MDFVARRLIKTPKLYFHDVGLAAYLCGIEEAKQLETHPLRGGFFENMVVCELIKARTNSGRDNRLMFFRDRAGREVDVLFPAGPRLLPMEIKSGKTIRGEWFTGYAGLDRLSADFLDSGVVVYGGGEIQRRSAGTACGLWQLETVIAEILGTKS